jgi:hypothetical protein
MIDAFYVTKLPQIIGVRFLKFRKIYKTLDIFSNILKILKNFENSRSISVEISKILENS